MIIFYLDYNLKICKNVNKAYKSKNIKTKKNNLYIFKYLITKIFIIFNINNL